MEADLVKREGVRFETIPSAQVHGVSWLRLPGNLWQMVRGIVASRRVLRRFRPDVLFLTGGYIAVPMALASRFSRIGKRLLYIPDIEPGWAVRTVGRFSDEIAVTTQTARDFFPKTQVVHVTGYPLRSELDVWSKADALAAFALRPDLPVLLVSGGSKGARSINRALASVLVDLLGKESTSQAIQVLHISGQLDWSEMERVRRRLNPEQAARYRLYPYLHKEMGAALRAADLAVARAGASVLGELPLFGLPAILVPYPYAWRYQRVNAQYLVERGAAEMVEDRDLPEKLLPMVHELIADTGRLAHMRQALMVLSHPQAAAEIANLLRNLADVENQSRA